MMNENYEIMAIKTIHPESNEIGLKLWLKIHKDYNRNSSFPDLTKDLMPWVEPIDYVAVKDTFGNTFKIDADDVSELNEKDGCWYPVRIQSMGLTLWEK